jgi:hypothetical protein
MNRHSNSPNIKRRTILAAIAATPLAAGQGAAQFQEDDDYGTRTRCLIRISENTGVPPNTVVALFDGLDLKAVEQAAKNVENIASQKWNARETDAAVIGLKAVEIFSTVGQEFPMYFYLETNIRNRGHRGQIKKSLGYFQRSGDVNPRLMDLAT